MKRLIIAADIHGHYAVWEKLINKLQPQDILVIAGDLFDTKYGHRDNPDFQPEKIRAEFQALPNPKHYVYGNCDVPSFFPGQKTTDSFEFRGKKVFVSHGDAEYDTAAYDVIISGHTHLPNISLRENKLYLNPGSLAKPHVTKASYIIWSQQDPELICLD